MIRLLIITPDYRVGGTNVSLKALLDYVNPSLVSIDIFALSQQGPYSSLFRNCTLLPENVFLSKSYDGGGLKWLFNKVLRVIKRVCSTIPVLGICVISAINRVGGKSLNSGNYDVIIAYQESLCSLLAAIPAKKRIIWIHSEYPRYLSLCKKDESRYYKNIDTVVCVSNFAKQKFLSIMPDFSTKVVVINNIINKPLICKKAEAEGKIPSDFLTDKFTIVSVGRIDPVKQFEKIPFIASQIINTVGSCFRWYIVGGSIGYENTEKYIMEEILKYGLEESVFLLGERTNVYPYIKSADVLVHTSKSETFSLVVNEALALSVPVVCNNYECAPEFVINQEDGFICSLDEMPTLLSDLMKHKDKLEHIKMLLEKKDFGVDKILDNFYKLLSLSNL